MAGTDGPLVPILVRSLNGRSGTTLMMQLLATCPEIAFNRTYPFENRYLTLCVQATHSLDPASAYIPARRPPPPQPGGRVAKWLRGRVHAPRDPAKRALPQEIRVFDPAAMHRQSVVALWEVLSERIRAQMGDDVRYTAEKGDWLDPAALPVAARSIVLVRDPRDIWASIHAFDEQRGFFGFGRRRGESRGTYLDRFVATTLSQDEANRAGDGDGSSIEVRYEDLVTQLDEATARIGDWLRVELNPAPVLEARDGLRHHMTSATPEASIGRWRTDVPESESRRLSTDLAPVLERYGYR